MLKLSSLKCLLQANPSRLRRLAVALVLCLIIDKQAAVALPSPEVSPEIVANSWDYNDDRFASITLNGKELLSFKENSAAQNDVTVGEKAEDIAAKIDQAVRTKKFSAEKLYPLKTKDGIVFKIDSTELFKLSASDLTNSVSISGVPIYKLSVSAQDNSDQPAVAKSETGKSQPEQKALEYGLKIANSIREAFGAKALPLSFLKLAEQAARQGVNSLSAIASAGASVKGHFSGTASWYGPHFHGRKCSDGTIFNQEGLTAAHRSLPFGTKLLVMNRRTGDSCVVKVNDRGPFIGNRIIDLSKGAARQLNMLGSGITMVDCIVLGDTTNK